MHNPHRHPDRPLRNIPRDAWACRTCRTSTSSREQTLEDSTCLQWPLRAQCPARLCAPGCPAKCSVRPCRRWWRRYQEAPAPNGKTAPGTCPTYPSACQPQMPQVHVVPCRQLELHPGTWRVRQSMHMTDCHTSEAGCPNPHCRQPRHPLGGQMEHRRQTPSSTGIGHHGVVWPLNALKAAGQLHHEATLLLQVQCKTPEGASRSWRWEGRTPCSTCLRRWALESECRVPFLFQGGFSPVITIGKGDGQ